MSIPVLSVRDVNVSFGSFQALTGISLDFLPGEVHAVVGENGAGKSTLMNVLGGFISPNTGTISWGSRQLLGRPDQHRTEGIGMVHQHFRLVPAFTVQQNLELGLMSARVSWAHALDVASTLGWSVKPQARLSELGVGEQQRVEILKALTPNPDVVIFDEPTAVLNEQEIAPLLEAIRTLAEQGKIVILIAHKLAEVFACANRISILRQGELVGTFLAEEVTPEVVAEKMVGEVPVVSRPLTKSGENVTFSASLVSGEVSLTDLRLDIRLGEVLGIGGVDGNGQVELAEFLVGVRDGGNSVRPNLVRVAYIPQDRHRDGLAVEMSISDNFRIAQNQIRRAEVQALIETYEIKARSPGDRVGSLSGGNQQKVVLARELGRNPELVVAVNPTRGLDVRSAAFVHQQLLHAAEAGSYVILISTDREEVAAVAHRQLFLSKGRLFSSEVEALAA